MSAALTQPRPPSFDVPFAMLLAEQIRWNRRRRAREAWFLAAIGALAIALYVAHNDARLLVSGVVAIVASMGVFVWARRRTDRSNALQTLSARGADVIWVFARRGESTAHEATLVFAIEDGTSVEFTVDPLAQDALLERASIEFATASIGFTKELRERFMVDPRSLRAAPRTRPVGRQRPEHDVSWMVPYAKSTLRGARLVGALGVLMLLLCGLALAIVIAAAKGQERIALAAVFGLLLAMSVAMTAWGFRRFERTELYRALTSGEGLSDVRMAQGHDASGDVIPLAMVTMQSGRRYTFAVPETKGR